MDLNNIRQKTGDLGYIVGFLPVASKALDASTVIFGPEGAGLSLVAKLKLLTDSAIPGWKRPIPNFIESLNTEAGAAVKYGILAKVLKKGAKSWLGIGLEGLDDDIEKFLNTLVISGSITAMVDPAGPSVPRGSAVANVSRSSGLASYYG